MSELHNILKRIENIENLEALKDLHRRYMYYVNSHQWDDVLDCFTDDAVADIGMHGYHQGKDELSELFKVKIAKVNEKWNGGHFVTQPIISVDGNNATGFWMLYICVYVKIDGRWKIKDIKYTRPWPDPPKH